MKKILCGLAALSLLGVACSREDSVSSRVENMYERDMDSEVGTGMSDEEAFDSGVGTEREPMMDSEDDMDIQREEMDMEMEREEEMIPVEDGRRGTGTGAGSSDASGMGMDE